MMEAMPANSYAALADAFDQWTAQDIHHTVSLKWNTYPAEVLPLWIADMDLPAAPELLSALAQRLQAPLGYGQITSLRERLIAQMADQGITDLGSENIHLMPAVVTGLYAAVATFTEPGEGVLALTPTYPPFHMAVQNQGRMWQGVPLADTPDGWQIDWAALEAAVTPQTRLLMLCHPHNPSGRVWTAAELERLADFVERHDLLVCSDELHADLVYPGSPEFRSFASLPQAAQRTVVLTGPGKTYNIAGLSIGGLSSPNAELVARVRSRVGGLMGSVSALNVSAWELALEHAQPWREEVLRLLKSNREQVSTWAKAEPLVRFHLPEATYLAWLDLRAHPQAHRIHAYLIEQGIGLNDGTTFTAPAESAAYQGFVRLNFATSRPVLTEALRRLSAALAQSGV